MDAEETRLLDILETAIRSSSLEERFDAIVDRLDRQLEDRSEDPMAWETVRLDLFAAPLPEQIRSAWIFVLRADVTTGAERHPNSHQRSMSYRGSGDFQTRSAENWKSHLLISDPRVPVDQRWLSIPTNVWHQLVVPSENWALISFHTVAEDELIEERPAAESTNGLRQTKYTDRDT